MTTSDTPQVKKVPFGDAPQGVVAHNFAVEDLVQAGRIQRSVRATLRSGRLQLTETIAPEGSVEQLAQAASLEQAIGPALQLRRLRKLEAISHGWGQLTEALPQ